MSAPDEVSRALADFAGTAPLFPLPNVVLFPRVVLPLHIFEQRYRKMVSDALDGNRQIAMALLRPGWEIHDPARPAEIHPTVCLGRVITHERLSDGRYYLMLEGLTRAVVERELETEEPYRTGVLRLEQDGPNMPSVDHDTLRRDLLAGFQQLFPDADVGEILGEVMKPTAPLGTLCDVLAYALRLEPETAQAILEEKRVEPRCELVLGCMRSVFRARGVRKPRRFPPPFSAN